MRGDCKTSFAAVCIFANLAFNILFFIWGIWVLIVDKSLNETLLFPWIIAMIICFGIGIAGTLGFSKKIFQLDFTKELQLFLALKSLVELGLFISGGTLWIQIEDNLYRSLWLTSIHNTAIMFLSFAIYGMLAQIIVITMFYCATTFQCCNFTLSSQQPYSQI